MKYTEGTKPDSPTEVVLAHYGVKGMKWGVRIAKPTSRQIVDARVRQAVRQREFGRTVDRLNLVSGGTDKKAQVQAVRNFEKARKEFLTNEDRVTAARTTRGEKLVQALLLGPLALVTIPMGKAQEVAVARSVDRERARR